MSAKKKISKTVVDAAKPPEKGQLFIWDSELKGFGLRVTPSRKTYIVQGRVKSKTVRITIGPHGPFTPEQARTEAKKHLGEMAKGHNLNQLEKDAKAKSITLGAAYQEYIQYKSLADNTLNDYSKAMRLGFGDWINKPIQEIKRDLIEDRFNKLSDRSPAQANQMFRFLRALLNFAKEKYASEDGEPLIPSNPCDRLTILKKWNRIERRTSYLEAHQLAPWFKALEHDPTDTEHRKTVKDFCAFILLTGCREQEAARLKWADVALDVRSITFSHTKNHRVHVLPIGKWLTLLLKRRAKSNRANDVFVFPAENKYGHLKHHRKSVLAISEKSGVQFNLHDLRRTFASIVNHQLSRTFSLYTIKRLLNHSGGDVTAGYIQFGVEDLREPMRLIETFVLEQAAITEEI